MDLNLFKVFRPCSATSAKDRPIASHSLKAFLRSPGTSWCKWQFHAGSTITEATWLRMRDWAHSDWGGELKATYWPHALITWASGCLRSQDWIWRPPVGIPIRLCCAIVLLELSLCLEDQLFESLHHLSHGLDLSLNVSNHTTHLIIWVAGELNGNLIECMELLLICLGLWPVWMKAESLEPTVAFVAEASCLKEVDTEASCLK